MSHWSFPKRDAYRVFLFMEGATALLFALIFTLNMVYYVEVVGLNPLQLVLVGTLLEIVAFTFEIPTGIVADVYSRRLSIIIGLLLIGLGFTISGLFPVFGIVLLSQVFWGLGATFTSGATQAWIADEIGEERAGRAFIRGAQIGQIGGLIGIGGAVALGSLSIQLPIVTGGLLMSGLGIVLAVIMPETGFHPTPQEDRSSWQHMIHTARVGFRLVRGRTVLVLLLAITAIDGLYSEGWDRLWTAHLLKNFTLPTIGHLDTVVWFGLINVVGLLCSLVATEIVRRTVNPQDERRVARVLIGFTAGMVGGIVVFGLAGRFGVALGAYFVVIVLRSLRDPLTTAWINRHVDSSVRATIFSMSGQVNAIGQIAGGPVVGVIGTVVSLRAAFLVVAAILSPMVALYARTMRLHAPPAGEEPIAAPASAGD